MKQDNLKKKNVNNLLQFDLSINKIINQTGFMYYYL